MPYDYSPPSQESQLLPLSDPWWKRYEIAVDRCKHAESIHYKLVGLAASVIAALVGGGLIFVSNAPNSLAIFARMALLCGGVAFFSACMSVLLLGSILHVRTTIRECTYVERTTGLTRKHWSTGVHYLPAFLFLVVGALALVFAVASHTAGKPETVATRKEAPATPGD